MLASGPLPWHLPCALGEGSFRLLAVLCQVVRLIVALLKPSDLGWALCKVLWCALLCPWGTICPWLLQW
jgi:hypothetical protein